MPALSREQFTHCTCRLAGTPGPAGAGRCRERSKGERGSTSEERALGKNGESSQRASERLGNGGQNVWIPGDDLLPAWPGRTGTQWLRGTRNIHKPGYHMKGFSNTLMSQGRVWQYESGSLKASFKTRLFCVAPEGYHAVAGDRQAVCRLSLGPWNGGEQYH